MSTKNLSDYELISFLGGGATARVYHARDKETNEEVAIKVIAKTRITNPIIKERVLSERKILKEMDHRSIIKLLCAFQDKTSLYFVLELAGRINLNEYLIRWGNQLPFELAKFYTAEIIAILVYLRDKSVAHRDLKPENFLVDDYGHLKLIDFNASTFVDKPTKPPSLNSSSSIQTDSKAFTSTSVNSSLNSGFDTTQLVGTYSYAPPEVLNMQLRNNFSADLWSLGCIAYQLFVGSPPFLAPSRSLIIERIRNVDYNFPKTLPDMVKDFINRLLVFDPELRLGVNNINEIYNHPLFNGMDVRKTHLRSPPSSPRASIITIGQDCDTTKTLSANELDALELTPNIGETFTSLKPLISMS